MNKLVYTSYLIMMEITRAKQFNKDFKKLPWFIQEKFYERLELYLQDPSQPLLNRHHLHGKYSDCLSINITGDFRLILKQVQDHWIELQRIGTHSQLYK